MSFIFFIACLHTKKNQENTEITTNIEKNENLKIIQYINDHYKTISLEKISQHFHYSIPYCSKWIKEKTGYSYYELLTHIKLQKGKQLLLNTTLSISQISKQLSYKILNLLFVPLKIRSYNASSI